MPAQAIPITMPANIQKYKNPDIKDPKCFIMLSSVISILENPNILSGFNIDLHQ